MPQLTGLILAGAASTEDDLIRRLSGRSRYGMPLANRALIRYGAESLINAGISEIIVAISGATVEEVGALLGDGSQYGVHFVYVERRSSESTLEVLRAVASLTPGSPLAVHAGDALVAGGLTDAVRAFERNRPEALLISEPARTAVPSPALVGGRPGAAPAWQHRHMGGRFPAAIFSVRALDELEHLSAAEATIGGTAAALAEAGHGVQGHTAPGCWCFAGDGDHLLDANREILDTLPHDDAVVDAATVRIEGRVAIHPGATIERTTVRGPAVIGSGANVCDTFIGPYTSIGAGATLEGAEIDNSIILPGARVRHLGRRIESSIIGVGADVTRDFAMPSAVRLRLGARSEVTLS